MPFCPMCGSEFRSGFSECNTCHVPLVASLNGTNREVEFVEDDPVDLEIKLLLSISSTSQASFVRRLLDESGIPSVIQGGHGDEIRTGEPYRIYVDEAWYDAGREAIESFSAPGLVTGQIEGDLARLEKELGPLEKAHPKLKPQLAAVRLSLQQLQNDLTKLNEELE